MDFGSLAIPRLVRQSNADPLPCHECGTMVDRGEECQDCNKDSQLVQQSNTVQLSCRDCGTPMINGVCQDCLDDPPPHQNPFN